MRTLPLAHMQSHPAWPAPPRCGVWIWLLAGLALCTVAGADSPPDQPERMELEWVLDSGGETLTGIVFDVREQDAEALTWLLPRLTNYLQLIHDARPGLPVALVAHGEEVALLTEAAARAHPDLHEALRELIRQRLSVHVCGSQASAMGLDESDFPPYVDVIPYGPAQIQDYKQMGYAHIAMELTW